MKVVKVLGVWLFLVACGRHSSSSPPPARDSGTSLATPFDAPRAAVIDASADANADAGWAGSVMDYVINSDGTPALTHPPKAPMPPLDRSDGPELEPSEQGFGFGRSGFDLKSQEPTGKQQGVLGHGGKYRQDAGAAP